MQKRVKRTESTDGVWQLEQLRQGWFTRDFDFETDEFIQQECKDIPTITSQQARLLSYANVNDLTAEQKRTIWPEHTWSDE